jgi:hypothetical protein
MLNVVHRGKTPELDRREAERMGYRSVVQGSDRRMRGGSGGADSRAPPPVLHPDLTVGDVFERTAARGWDALRTRSRADPELR